jgi:hypothetical protein
MIGSALEHAARCHAKLVEDEVDAFLADAPPSALTAVYFKQMFLDSEGEDEHTSALITVLETLRRKFQDTSFEAREVAHYASQAEESAIAFKEALEIAAGKPIKIISSTTITWRLKAVADARVKIGKKIVCLIYKADPEAGTFKIQQKDEIAG